MDINLLKSLRGLSGDGRRLNKKVITFGFCLIASVFFWLVSVFSKQYSNVIYIPVNYTNLPSDRIVSVDLPQTIGIKVKASGFRIALFKVLKKVDVVTIDAKEIKPYKKGFYLATGSKIDDLARQLASEFEVIRIYPDTLFFNFEARVEKIVPVKLRLEIDYEKQFNLSDSIRISPNAIQITGSADAVNKINYVETEKLIIKNANELITKRVELKQPPKDVKFSVSSVNVTIPVVQFTEGIIDVPLSILNLPNAYSIKTFPDKVSLRYLVAYENFNKIRPEMFTATVDYEKIDFNNNRLRVEVKNFPAQYINENSLNISPERVEYIIRKK